MFRILINGTPARWSLKTKKEATDWIKRAKKRDKALSLQYGFTCPIYKISEEP